nr:unnamed protein product [Callosobruchus chinensis]
MQSRERQFDSLVTRP